VALTVASIKHTLPPGATAVRVRITAADDGTGTTAAIPVADLPEGVAYRLADVRARDDAGSATAWQPSVTVGGVVVYRATSGTPGTLADQPGCYLMRGAGETVTATFGWDAGSDNDGVLELLLVPAGVA
jgi:hypothetical protein